MLGRLRIYGGLRGGTVCGSGGSGLCRGRPRLSLCGLSRLSIDLLRGSLGTGSRTLADCGSGICALLCLYTGVGPLPFGKGIGRVHFLHRALNGSFLRIALLGLRLLTCGTGGLILLIFLFILGLALGTEAVFAAIGTLRGSAAAVSGPFGRSGAPVHGLIIVIVASAAAEDGLRVRFLVIFIVLIVIIVIIPGLFAAEQHVEDKNETEHGDKDISHVEYRKARPEVQPEHILHIAVEDTVDAIGEAACHNEHRAPAPDGAGNKVGGESDYHADGKDAADNNEIYPGSASAEEAERCAVIVDVHKADYTGDKLLYTHAYAEVACNPILHPLVKYDDQYSNYCIQHIILLSAAGKPAAREIYVTEDAAEPVRTDPTPP